MSGCSKDVLGERAADVTASPPVVPGKIGLRRYPRANLWSVVDRGIPTATQADLRWCRVSPAGNPLIRDRLPVGGPHGTRTLGPMGQKMPVLLKRAGGVLQWVGIAARASRAPGRLAENDFDRAIDSYRLGTFVTGDPSQVADLFSQREDITLANPLGPPRRGRVEVAKAITEAAAHFSDGVVLCEEVSRYSTPELGYVVQIERMQLQLIGREGMSASSLRVTMILRREGDAWRVAHRHADPITSARPIGTALDT
jgi:ketosteroid isomerase-like protein